MLQGEGEKGVRGRRVAESCLLLFFNPYGSVTSGVEEVKVTSYFCMENDKTDL